MIVSANDTINLKYAIDQYKIGYDNDDEEEKQCPICGAYTFEFFYNSVVKDIVGCVNCVTTIYANEI